MPVNMTVRWQVSLKCNGWVKQVIWRMVYSQIKCKQQPLSEEEENALNLNPVERKKTNCTIFLGYTSNMISAGVRDTIRFLVQHNMVSVQLNLFCKVNYLVQGYLATNRRCVQKILNTIVHLPPPPTFSTVKGRWLLKDVAVRVTLCSGK